MGRPGVGHRPAAQTAPRAGQWPWRGRIPDEKKPPALGACYLPGASICLNIPSCQPQNDFPGIPSIEAPDQECTSHDEECDHRIELIDPVLQIAHCELPA